MEFTINSKQKKVELFYETQEEQRAILDFINKWMSFKTVTDITDNASIYIKQPDIAWASISGSTDNYLTNTIATSAVSLAAECNGSKAYSDKINSAISSIEESVSNQPSYITVTVPRSDKSK